MRLKLISCEVFNREMADASARSPNQIELELVSRRVRNESGSCMRRRLQKAIDSADRSKFHAVLLGYGFCTVNLSGLHAREIPLVIPRCFDCIAAALAQRDRCVSAVKSRLVLHFNTAGRNQSPCKCRPTPNPVNKHLNCGCNQLASNFGGEVARFLFEQFNAPHAARGRGLIFRGAQEQASGHRNIQPASSNRLRPGGHQENGRSVTQRLVDGYWSHTEFLVVPPGWQLTIEYDQGLTSMKACR